ncbi:cytoplasmic protein, partial [Candidatus Pelagibacter sp.]|nr:cytoplasmic protein [Candidatus Pelagibacter sp.]
DGDKYIGGWKDGRKTGQGTLTYADGTKFTGEWNEYDGIFTHTDGTKFVGEWDWKRDGKPIK